jgi:hypothetical protein
LPVENKAEAPEAAKKRQAPENEDCFPVKCIDAPHNAGNCTKIPSLIDGIGKCCSDYECTAEDGTKSTFSGGSKAVEKSYSTPVRSFNPKNRF